MFADKLSENGRAFLKEVVNADFIISVAVEIEVLTFHDVADKMLLIEKFISMATIIPLDTTVTKKAIEIRRKHRKLKLGDAIIAASALVENLILVTNNEKDFSNIKGLKLIDPQKL